MQRNSVDSGQPGGSRIGVSRGRPAPWTVLPSSEGNQRGKGGAVIGKGVGQVERNLPGWARLAGGQGD